MLTGCAASAAFIHNPLNIKMHTACYRHESASTQVLEKMLTMAFSARTSAHAVTYFAIADQYSPQLALASTAQTNSPMCELPHPQTRELRIHARHAASRSRSHLGLYSTSTSSNLAARMRSSIVRPPTECVDTTTSTVR